VQSYASYSLKRIFNVHDLDLAKVARAFGFSVPPAVTLPVGGLRGDKAPTGSKKRKADDGGDIDLALAEDVAEAGPVDGAMDTEMNGAPRRHERAPTSRRSGEQRRGGDAPNRRELVRKGQAQARASSGSVQWGR